MKVQKGFVFLLWINVYKKYNCWQFLLYYFSFLFFKRPQRNAAIESQNSRETWDWYVHVTAHSRASIESKDWEKQSWHDIGMIGKQKSNFKKMLILRLVRDWIWKWTCLLLFITFKRSNYMTVISNELQIKFKSDEIEVYSFPMNYNDVIRYKVVISSYLEVMCCLNLV